MSANDDVIKERTSSFARGPAFLLLDFSSGREFHRPRMRAHGTRAMTGPVSIRNIVAQVPRFLGRALVKLYRITLSPLIGFHCRYLPTCSEYADQALQQHGLWAGGWMTLARLMRCPPWGNSGLDYVPPVPPPDARW